MKPKSEVAQGTPLRICQRKSSFYREGKLTPSGQLIHW